MDAGANRWISAVVVTHNRSQALQQTLRAIATQSVQPNQVIVVDSGSTDSTPTQFSSPPSNLIYMRFEDNIGPAAGRARGMARAIALGAAFCWLVDDDTEPHDNALSALVDAAKGAPDAGVVGFRGGVVRLGQIVHTETEHELRRFARARRGDLYAVDFTLLDGSLVSAAAIRSAGVPREDFFIMMEDVEYPLRLQKQGFNSYVLARDLMAWRHLGSQPGDQRTLWRNYYQARNHTRMAMDLGMPLLWLGVVRREAAFVFRYVGQPGGKIRLALRRRGVVDALRGRMGRCVEPGTT